MATSQILVVRVLSVRGVPSKKVSVKVTAGEATKRSHWAAGAGGNGSTIVNEEMVFPEIVKEEGEDRLEIGIVSGGEPEGQVGHGVNGTHLAEAMRGLRSRCQ